MTKYIDILVTADGVFCIAPPWTINEGDYIALENVFNGETELKKVIATATDSEDGDFIKLVEAYIGYKPHKVAHKYRANTIHWGDEEDVQK